MNDEKYFRRFVTELLVLTKKHAVEWDEAERGIYDIEEIIDRSSENNHKQHETVLYPKGRNRLKNTKKSTH